MAALVFAKTPHGNVALLHDAWPREIEVGADVLTMGQPFIEADEDGFLSFSVANGNAFYRMVRMHGTPSDEAYRYTCRLVHGYVGVDP